MEAPGDVSGHVGGETLARTADLDPEAAQHLGRDQRTAQGYAALPMVKDFCALDFLSKSSARARVPR